MRILIIEDEPGIAESVREYFEASYSVDVASNGKTGLSHALSDSYDLLIVDLGLPGLSGKEICLAVRKADKKVPILVLTARNTTEEKVLVLDSGADDYLTKPFSLPELGARVRAMLRRGPALFETAVLTCENLQLDSSRRIVLREGKEIPLRRKEFDLLEFMLRHQDQVITRKTLLDHLWDDEHDPFTNVVDVHIKYLRDKVDKPFGLSLIKTVHGVGYKLNSF